MRILSYILFPFAILYRVYTDIRNILFDYAVLPQTNFRIPTISVGNITVGGTGKTPHVQYLIELLKDYKTASLSRGYKRKTKGFILANEKTTVTEIGDEPFLLHKRFPLLHVAVCEKRVDGVYHILEQVPDVQTIVLDDAYQHRYIKPDVQILLVDYNRPLWKDFVFPMGRLRENRKQIKRSDIVIVSKCPKNVSSEDIPMWKDKLGLHSQALFFSSMNYGAIYNAHSKKEYNTKEFLKSQACCIVTGIAQPNALISYVKSFGGSVSTKIFPDHYEYSLNDKKELQKIADNNIIVTTEKDVYKMSSLIPNERIFVLPISPIFLFEQEQEFKNMIFSAIREKKYSTEQTTHESETK